MAKIGSTGKALLIFLFSISASAKSHDESRFVLVIEQHSHIGFEQSSLTQLPGEKLQLVSNSNFVTESLPALLGIFEARESANDEKEIRKIVKADRKSPLSSQRPSPHRLRILLNGDELSEASPAYELAKQFAESKLNTKNWQVKSGHTVDAKEVADMKCEPNGVMKKICQSKLGWIHTSK